MVDISLILKGYQKVITMSKGLYLQKRFVAIKAIGLHKMVGDEVVGWNPFLASLISLAQELESLGLVYYNSSVSYIELGEVSHV